MFLFSTMTFAQSVTLKGTVTDKGGEPIIGANVIVENTTNGTITNVDGEFTLQNVQQGSALKVSFIGYKTQIVPVGSSNNIKITLPEDSEALDEVVVVGYAVQRKVNLTGSVSSVKGDELSHRPVANATQSLQGLVPGLTVNNSSSGRPGAEASLTLRGQGNLANTANPYVLVDGVEMSLADVNPNDIESISVLKDAAACAIYGARAAYGVILVTTKKGEDGKMRVSYQGTVGWSSPTVLPEMANAYDFAQYFNAGCANANVTQQYSKEKLELLKQYVSDPTGIDCWSELNGQNNLIGAFENTAKGVGNVDYFKLHYKDAAFKQNHNLSLSGGGKKAQYYVSGGAYTEDGIMRYADISYKRYNFNGSIASQLTDWLKMKVNTKFVHSDSKTPFGNGGLSDGFYHSLARFRPTVSPVDPNGNFTELTMIPYLQSGTYTDTQRDNMTLTGGLEAQPVKNWRIFFDYTYRHTNQEYEALNVAPQIVGADGVTTYKGTRSELGIADNGSFTRSMYQRRYQSINLYTNYIFSIAQKHNFTLMGGYQEEDYHYSYLYNKVTDLISTTNPALDLATGNKNITDTRNGWATRGFFGRVNYDYNGLYLIEANGRYDGSSRFASGNRWGFFPSVSVGWNISREEFMEKTSKVLSNLKLRASWGLLGNQSGAGLYTFASTMGVTNMGNYYFADGRDMYINAPGVVDPNTTWEKVESKNIGIDFGFFGNSLTGTFDVFQRDTKDMLGPSADLADIFGATVPNTNNARMRNRGWELTLQYKGKITKDISYTIGASLADATSEVTAYENPTGTDPAGNWYTGRKVGEIWGYRADGLIQTQEEADAYNSTYNLSYLSGQKWTPGDVRYLDLNGDKAINNGKNTLNDMGDLTVIGNTTPRYQYTLNGSVSWKGLTLSMMLQGVGKRDWNPGGSVYFWGCGPYAQVTVFKQHLDYWSESNPGAYYPKPYTAGAGAIAQYRNKTSQACDRYMQNAAYCRLKNLTISYDLPEAWTKKVGLNKTQVFVSGENLLTFTKLADMFDPEAIFTSNDYTSEGGKNYPMNKVISFGLIVNL
ncbi:MAG: TonB-dependent receptor [Bacteroides helcogenes]|nr:TonB-dependent receptor [Bacteroides helcogenes]MDY5237758.1 TonB-dependent receptor [Bacteroides helcogenes]